MSITRITIELPDNILDKLDEEAKTLMEGDSRPTQFEWLNGSPEGRELWIDISCRGKYNRLSNNELNAMIRKQYTEATGGTKIGRPALGVYRARVIAGLLQNMEPSPKIIKKVVRQYTPATQYIEQRERMAGGNA